MSDDTRAALVGRLYKQADREGCDNREDGQPCGECVGCMLREAADHLAAPVGEQDELRKAVRTILRGFHEGVFVRSINDDMRPGWAVRLLPFIAAMGTAQKIVGDPCLGEDCAVHGGPNPEGTANVR